MIASGTREGRLGEAGADTPGGASAQTKEESGRAHVQCHPRIPLGILAVHRQLILITVLDSPPSAHGGRPGRVGWSLRDAPIVVN